jgi:hypothetical protein
MALADFGVGWDIGGPASGAKARTTRSVPAILISPEAIPDLPRLPLLLHTRVKERPAARCAWRAFGCLQERSARLANAPLHAFQNLT